MTEPNAVQQAVDLLTGRLAEARQRRSALTAEISTIESAIASLGSLVPAVIESAIAMEPPGSTISGPKMSVRAAVKAILDGEERSFTPAEIGELVPAVVMAGKTKQQRTNSVRTALWSLRQKKEARLDGDKTISVKWPTPEPDPELPADNGAGSSAHAGAIT